MVDGIKDGAAAKAVTTYMEEEARRTFEAGKATFMRNWPYAYALDQKRQEAQGQVRVAPFPSFEGGGKAGDARRQRPRSISAYSKNPGARAEFIDYLTSRERKTENDAEVLAAVGADGRRTTSRR